MCSPGWHPYLHAAVADGVDIEFVAASLPVVSSMSDNAAIPMELWGVGFVGAVVGWGMSEGIARFVWEKDEAASRP